MILGWFTSWKWKPREGRYHIFNSSPAQKMVPPSSQMLRPEPRYHPLFLSFSHTSPSDLQVQLPNILRIQLLFTTSSGPSPIISSWITAVASAWVSLFLPLSTQSPEGSCYNLRWIMSPLRTFPWFSIHSESEPKSLPWPIRPCVICAPIISLTSLPTGLPLAHSTPGTLASLLILKCASHIPASGPLHVLLLLPGAFLPQIAEWFALPLLYHFPQVLPSQEGLS